MGWKTRTDPAIVNDPTYLEPRITTVEVKNNDLSVQLTNKVKQVDLVELLREHNVTSDKIYAKILGDKDFEVTVPFKGNKCGTYRFKKPAISGEDYIVFQEGYISEIASPSITLRENYDSMSGTWAGVTLDNNYTTNIGATMTKEFNGVGIDFQALNNDKGGVWEFVIDGDTAGKVTVSTFNAVSQKVVHPIARGLVKGSHTVVATFKGDDPLNPPSTGAGTGRGWIKFDSGTYPNSTTFLVYDDIPTNTKKYDVLRQDSNKEFAIRVKPNGSELNTEFMPGHVSTATMFSQDQKIYFDNVEITNWTPDVLLREVKSVQIIQRMLGKHPQDTANPMAEVFSIHTVTSKGVSIKIKIKFLRELYCTTGYGIMFPVKASFAKKLITSLGNSYDSIKTDGSSTDIVEDDKAISYAFINTGGTAGEPDVVAAMTVQNIFNSFKYGREGRRSTLAWLQHRDADIQKLYTQPYLNTVIPAGETFEVGGTFFIGELPYAIDILI